MTSSSATSTLPEIVDSATWDRARAALLAAEKAATRALDQVAAQRRRLPMVEFRPDYALATPEGPASLLDLFGGKQQLVIYQFMDAGPHHLCEGCTWFTDGVPANSLVRLAQAGVAWFTVSNMPIEQMQRVWSQHRWTHIPFASSRGTSFTSDCGAGDGFLLSVFLRQEGKVYRTYSTRARGVDRLAFANSVRDLLPFGRQEAWEDSPPGVAQHSTWWLQDLPHPFASPSSS